MSKNFYVVQSWMTDKRGLALKGNELNVYAVIYGFSQDGSICYASRQYIANLVGIERKESISDITKRLCEKGYIIKEGAGFKAAPYSQSTEYVLPDESVCGSTDIVSVRYEKGTEEVRETYTYNKEIYKYIDKYIGNSKLVTGCPEEALELIERWFKYKCQIKKGYKTKEGAEKFVTELMANCGKYGIDKCREVIDYSVSNGYQGCFWDRLAKQKPEIPKVNNGIDETESIYSSNSSYDVHDFMMRGLHLDLG